MKAHIGTSGWQYKHWRERFYPRELRQQDWLKFFSKRFDTVEINTSFYNLPSAENFKRWAEQVAQNKKFVFSIKLYRLFTHYKRLKLGREELKYLDLFFRNASELGSAAGPILVQLPPSLKCDLELFERFISQARKSVAKYISKPLFCAEFRHISWFQPEVYKKLKRLKVALVVGDSPRWPMRLLKTADFVYLRLHGSQKLYASEYSSRELREWWQAVKDLKPKTAFFYFDNDGHAYAVKNAKFLQNLA